MDRSKRIHLVWALSMAIAGLGLAVFGPMILYFAFSPNEDSGDSMKALFSGMNDRMEMARRIGRGATWFVLGGYGVTLVSMLYAFFLWAQSFVAKRAGEN